jgi:transposase
MRCMLGLPDLSSIDEQQLPADVALALQVMRRHIELQAGELDDKTREIETKSREIAWRDARLEKLQLELARLKRWKFDAKSEAMTAQQRVLFAETLAEDEADLQAQLAALQALAPQPPETPKGAPRRPRRQALPEHLQRVEHRHEPADPTARTPAAVRRCSAWART